MYPNLIKTIQNQESLKLISFKAGPNKVTLRLNNNKQYVNITNGQSTKSTYGKIDLKGFPLFKTNTPQEIKDKLEELEQDPKLKAKLKAVPCAACSICGKPLTDPASIEAGIGPECAANGLGEDMRELD